MSEPKIIINGVELDQFQSYAVRSAVNQVNAETVNALVDSTSASKHRRTNEVLKIMGEA